LQNITTHIGGFVSETIGFKYIFIILAALAGASAVIGLPFLKETYAPVIQEKIAKQNAKKAEANEDVESTVVAVDSQQNLGGRMSDESKPQASLSAVKVDTVGTSQRVQEKGSPPAQPNMKEILKTSLTRPVMILTRSFIGLMMSLFMAL